MQRASELITREDPLTYLPRRPVQEFARRRIIYGPDQPSEKLYLVIRGRVIVTSAVDGGSDTIGRIVCTEGLFGESAMVGRAPRSESAVALDSVCVMAWTRDEIESQIDREPRLGIALSQYLVGQCIELQERIESMAVHKTPERVMLALVQLAGTLGTPMPDGTTRLASLTHHTIADFVGTSREIVTFQMNRLRRLGLMKYSRKHIDMNREGVQALLSTQGISVSDILEREALATID
jgi:CRP/FNR family transcriptional regulator, cyclic AMP receptor protein